MSENVLKTIQTILQDVIAPDIRQIKAQQQAMQQQMDLRFDAMQQQMDTRFKEMDTRFREVDTRFKSVEQQIEFQVGGLKQQFDSHVGSVNAKMDHLEKQLLSAFAASQLQTELNGAKMVVDLRERVAVLESQRAA